MAAQHNNIYIPGNAFYVNKSPYGLPVSARRRTPNGNRDGRYTAHVPANAIVLFIKHMERADYPKEFIQSNTGLFLYNDAFIAMPFSYVSPIIAEDIGKVK